MELIRQWLLCITGTTLLVALVDSFMPQGPVKHIGRLICGLLLLITIVTPILKLSQEQLELIGSEWKENLMQQEEDMEHYYNNQLKFIIEQEFVSYILDKAMEWGYTLYPIVQCQLNSDGIYVPIFIELHSFPSELSPDFIDTLCEDLALDPSQIQTKEVTHEILELPQNP